MEGISQKGLTQIEEWKAEKAIREFSPEERCCISDANGDCKHLTSALSWWCANPDAIKYRGTSIPDTYGCPFHEYKPKKPSPLSILKRIGNWLKQA